MDKQKLWAYTIFTARFLLAWIFFGYGWSKLTDGQFGISDVELATPLKDLSLFKVAWYLFDHQPFKWFIGVMQIIGAFLLVFNRTVILGALWLIPVILTILIIDLTFMPGAMKVAFGFRLSSYLIADLLILFYYKKQMKNMFLESTSTEFNSRFPIWMYILLPVSMLVLSIILWFPKLIFDLIDHPEATIDAIRNLPEYFKKLGS